ncbi:hypothetical protein EVAR_70440_1 [Eumeta japonica]|uniref:Uncharacterized protein n=1 Tax=Eumeta variegata TaxID=151549 RepID=A0A4C1SEF0_EUMVA|nr:hypothetical protein EVAR_70440_1 [Eumeta japonica]
MYTTSLWSTCDERKFELTGHYLFHFNNCTIEIGDRGFGNRVVESTQVFSLPTYPKQISTEKVLTYQDIILQQQNNLEKIEELRFHRTVGATLEELP